MGKHLVILFALLALVGCKESGPTPIATEGTKEEARVIGVLTDYQGQWLVVNYFAEWCAPCIREIPLLNKLHHLTLGPTVLAVSYDELSDNKLQGLKDRYQMQMPIVHELKGDWPFERPRVLPTSFVINPSGKLVAQHQGELTDKDLKRWKSNYWH